MHPIELNMGSETAKFEHYIYWFAHKHMGIKKSSLDTAAINARRMSIVGFSHFLYGAACRDRVKEGYNVADVVSTYSLHNQGGRMYIHFDRDEYGFGERRDLLCTERTEEHVIEFLDEYAEKGRNTAVYSATVIVWDEDLNHEFNMDNINAGHHFDGYVKNAAAPKPVELPSPRDVLYKNSATLAGYLKWYLRTYIQGDHTEYYTRLDLVTTIAGIENVMGDFARHTTSNTYDPNDTGADYYVHFDRGEENTGVHHPEAKALGIKLTNSACCELQIPGEVYNWVYRTSVIGFGTSLLIEYGTYCTGQGTTLAGRPNHDDHVEPLPTGISEAVSRTESNVPTQTIGAELAHPTITGDAIVTGTTNLLKEEELTMNTPTQTTRRVVKITLMDNDAGIREASDALVKEWDGIVTQDDDATTIQELIMNKDVAGALKAHNTKRATLVNRDILNRTGNEVKLEPVRLNELTWTVK